MILVMISRMTLRKMKKRKEKMVILMQMNSLI